MKEQVLNRVQGDEEEKAKVKKKLDMIEFELDEGEKDIKKAEKFWVPMFRFNEEEGKEVTAGYVQCSFRIYPTAAAEKNPQGVGRDAPNTDPVLPEPEGRLKLSLNPFTMFN